MKAFASFLSFSFALPWNSDHQCTQTIVPQTRFFARVNNHAHPMRGGCLASVCKASATDNGMKSLDNGEHLVVNSPESLEKAMSLIGVIPEDEEATSGVTDGNHELDNSRDSNSSPKAFNAQKDYSSQEIASTLLAFSFPSDTFDTKRIAHSDYDDAGFEDTGLINADTPLDSNAAADLDDSHSSSQSGSSAGTRDFSREKDPKSSSFLMDNQEDDATLYLPDAYEEPPPSLEKSVLNKKLSSVHERRQQVSRRTGAEALRITDVVTTSATNNSSDYSAILEKSKNDVHARWHIESTQTASILSVERGADETQHSALASIAAKLCFLHSQVPFRPKPFPALRKAVFDANSVNCALCKFPILKTDLRAGHFCDQCYSKIFVQIDSPTAPLPQHKSLGDLPREVREIVEKIWQDRGVQKRKASEGTRVKTIRADTSERTQFRNSASSTSQKHAESHSVGIGPSGDLSSKGATSNGRGPSVPPPPPIMPSVNGEGRSDEWVVTASDRSLRTINPIRNLVQGIDVKPNPAKELIKLSVGDPTLYGNLKVSEEAMDKYCEVIREMQSNGYSVSMGSLEARTAVAERYSLPEAPLSPNDIVLTAGTSGALEVAIGVLVNEGNNILIPQPGFPLFRTIAEGFGVECRSYKLLPNESWTIDLKHLATLVDSRTVAIVVNNPSNPCGSVFERSHIQDLLKTASELHLPIIADEVYADMVFSGRQFTSIASQSKCVPVLSVGGISKQFVVPGWRLGWILIHDRGDVFELGHVRKGIRQLTTRMLVPNTPVQAVLPTLLRNGVENASFQDIMQELEINATFTAKALASAPGIRCIEPQGSMYAMVEIDANLLGFEDDMHFTKALLEEESVFVLPGQCFQASNFVRIVFCAPRVVLSEAFHRIRSFCSRHAGVL